MLVLTAFSWNDCCFTSPRFVPSPLRLLGDSESQKDVRNSLCYQQWALASRAAGNHNDAGNRGDTRVRDDY